ncbi:MAG: ATP-binding protein [Acidobacteriota bacterium]
MREKPERDSEGREGPEREEVLEVVNRVGRLLTAELDLEKLVQAVTDAATELSRAAFGAFFYNARDDRGGKYLLYILSGAPREAFAQFPMPRATELFGPTFTGAGPVRLPDVTKDPRYGKNAPYNGMPIGHLPVKSYLAIPVVSRSGEVLGGLFFGHPDAGIFTDREEKLVTGLAAQAAIAIDNARLFEEVGRQRAAAAAEEQRHRFLSDASAVLATSLHEETTLAAVARLCVPTVADWCLVDVIDDQGSERRIAVVGEDGSVAGRLALATGAPKRLLSLGDAAGDKPEAFTVITADMLAAAERASGDRDLLARLAPRSAIVIPLVAHGSRMGRITWIACGPSGRRYKDGDVAVAQELARRASQAVENARLYRDVQEANRLKEEFLATLSHELRTPLTAILGWSQLLRENRLLGENVGKAIEAISRNALAQNQLISDVLDVSRIVAGKLRLEPRRIDPISVVQSALDTVRPAAEHKGVRLDLTFDAASGTLWADPSRIEQIVWNLLVNGVKFVDRGGHVHVHVRPEGPRLLISVEDDGPGIEEQFLPHVFERFRQADSSSTRAHRGLGLGLAIVKHLSEMHGGTVGVANREGRGGAAFIVSLPRSGIDHVASAGDPRLERANPPWLAPAPELHSVAVLVVDDEPDAREVISAMLGICGARVATAASADEGLEAFQRERPDVLLIDVEMPGADGYDLLRRVRALPAEKGGKTPAAAVTAYASMEDRMKALRAGFQMHCPKPVQPIELAKMVASLAGRAVKG